MNTLGLQILNYVVLFYAGVFVLILLAIIIEEMK